MRIESTPDLEMPKQKIFLSWSKPDSSSQRLATILRDWLPQVLQQVQPWLSSKDLEPGTRWNSVISGQLQGSEFGIFCVTPESQASPWMLFEAGAIAKSSESRAYVYLFHLRRQEVISPWNQFQLSEPNKDDTYKLVNSLNKSLGDDALESNVLERSFSRSWDDLEAELRAIDHDRGRSISKRTLDKDKLIEQIFNGVLEQSRQGARVTSDISNIKESLKLIAGSSVSVDDGALWTRFKTLKQALRFYAVPHLAVSSTPEFFRIRTGDVEFTVPRILGEAIKQRKFDPGEVEALIDLCKSKNRDDQFDTLASTEARPKPGSRHR